MEIFSPSLWIIWLDHLADGHRFILDEVLFVEAVFLVELFHLAVDDFFDDRLGLAGGAGLRLVDFALAVENFLRDVLAADEARIERGNVHGHVVAQALEIFGARDEIGFAIDFDHHADFSAGVNVVADQAFGGLARRLLLRGGLPLLAQDVDGAFRCCPSLRPAPSGNRQIPRRFAREVPSPACAGILTDSMDLSWLYRIPSLEFYEFAYVLCLEKWPRRETSSQRRAN